MKTSQLARDLKPYIVPWITDAVANVVQVITVESGGGGGGGAATSYSAGDGIDISGNTILVDVTDIIDTDYGLTESGNDIRINLAAPSGLEFASGALRIKDDVAGSGLAISGKILSVNVGDGLDLSGDNVVVDVTDILGFGLTEASNNILIDETEDFAWTGWHDFSVGAQAYQITFDNTEVGSHVAADGLTYYDLNITDADLGSPGVLSASTRGGLVTYSSDDGWGLNLNTRNMEVVKAAFYDLTTNAIYAAGDLTIDPTGNVEYPDAQIAKSDVYAFSLLTGVDGWKRYQRSDDAIQLDIEALQANELFVRYFTADEIRVQRGAQIWARSYGIIAEDFVIPAIYDSPDYETVAVHFENAAGLTAAADLFVTGNMILVRSINWGTGLTVQDVQFQVGNKLENAGAFDADYYQRWNLRRMYGGTTDGVIKKGTVAVDLGTVGQGRIELSALKNHGGPWIKFMRWTGGANPMTGGNNYGLVQLGALTDVLDSAYDEDDYGVAIGTNVNDAAVDYAGLILHHSTGLSLYNSNLYGYDSGVLTCWLAADGTLRLGADVTANETTGFRFIASSGDVFLGNTVSGANIQWDASEGRLNFRNVTTTQVYVDTDGKIYAGGGAVILDVDGISIMGANSEGTITDANQLKLYNPSGTLFAHLVATGTTGTNFTFFDAFSNQGERAEIWMRAYGDSHPSTTNDYMAMSISGDDPKAIFMFSIDPPASLVVHAQFETDKITFNEPLELNDDLYLKANDFLYMRNYANDADELILHRAADNALTIGHGLAAGSGIDLRIDGATIQAIHEDTIEMNKPLLLEGTDAITSNPPAAANSAGWKMSLFSNTYAMGIAPNTLALKTGSGVGFFTDNPAGGAFPDNAFFAANGSYLYTSAALGEAWTNASYADGWETYSASYHAAGYKKFGDMVFLRGMLGTTSTDGDGTVVFTLPSGYYNGAKIIVLKVMANSGGGPAIAMIQVTTNGDVYFYGDATNYLSLDGVNFSVA